MSGQQTDSQPKSPSTGTPRELDSPQPLGNWADELTQFLPQEGVEVLEPSTPAPAPDEPAAPPPEPSAPEPQPRTTILTPQRADVPMTRVVEDGKEVVRADVIKAVVELGSLGQLVRIRKAAERELIKGEQDPRNLAVTEDYQHIHLINDPPHAPWATAYFYNRGPDSAFIAVNKARPWVELALGEDQELDFTKSESRIWFIECQCNSGETATVRAMGKY